MEKKGFSQRNGTGDVRLSLAEEQQRAFEDDKRRFKRLSSSLWPGFLFRN